jgi:excisionase family DNA binding protein
MSKTAEDEPTLLKPSSVARRWDCSTKSIYRLIKGETLKAVRTPGGELRISIDEVRRYERSLVAA